MTASTQMGKFPVFRVGPLEVDLNSDQALVDEKPIALTERQFKILAVLVANAEEIVGVLAIQKFCENGEGDQPPDIFLQIKDDVEAIRQSLEERTNFFSIESVRRVGYRFSAQKGRRNSR